MTFALLADRCILGLVTAMPVAAVLFVISSL